MVYEAPEFMYIGGALLFGAFGVLLLLSNPAGNSTRGEAYGPDAPLQGWVIVLSSVIFLAAASCLAAAGYGFWVRLSRRTAQQGVDRPDVSIAPPAEIEAMLRDTVAALSSTDDFLTPVTVGLPTLQLREGIWSISFSLTVLDPPSQEYEIVLLPLEHRVGGGAECMIHDDVMELVDADPGIAAKAGCDRSLVL